MRQKLSEELGSASDRQSHVNRQSDDDSCTSAIQKLSQFGTTHANGPCVFGRAIIDKEGKERKPMMDFESLPPFRRSLYACDRQFHVALLYDMLETNMKSELVMLDAEGCLYGVVTSESRRVLHRFTGDLPKKQTKGGQLSVRFARLRLEVRHNDVRKAAEIATEFVRTGAEANVTDMILADSADFKAQGDHPPSPHHLLRRRGKLQPGDSYGSRQDEGHQRGC
jgi:peptide chain release factor subunit 1